jgi:hypothetical protein
MCKASLVVLSLTLLAGCSSSTPRKDAKLYQAGEKAQVGKLLYSVVDTQFAPTIGEDANNQRTPQNRFVIVQVSISNSGTEDSAIPGMTLVGDDGKTYPEIADLTGVPRWLGVVRKATADQTEQGVIVFDAPAQHYRLRLTDDLDDDVSIDVPLSFIHELQHDIHTPESSGTPGVLDVPTKK